MKRIFSVIILVLVSMVNTFGNSNPSEKETEVVIGKIIYVCTNCYEQPEFVKFKKQNKEVINIELGYLWSNAGSTKEEILEVLNSYKNDFDDINGTNKFGKIKQWKITCFVTNYYGTKHYTFSKIEEYLQDNDTKSYAGEYFEDKTGYKCYIFKKNNNYYFSYSNNINEAHILKTLSNTNTSKFGLECAWTEPNGLSQTIDIGFTKNKSNTILFVKSFYRGHTSEHLYLKDKNIPNSKKIFYNVTYINSTPSTGIEFKVSYSDNSPVFLGNNPKHTDINVAKGEYLIKFKLLGDGDSGWYSYRSGKISINKNITIDFFKDVYSITEIDESTYNKGFN